MAGTGFPSGVANSAQMCTAIVTMQIAKKKIIVPRIATVQSLNLRAVCQGIIPVVANHDTSILESRLPRCYSIVANRSIRAQFATKELNPVPASYFFCGAVAF
jgi:hypothetical protein